jgi:sterol desaturase/sphingolipid hydroxylase (fatty acid hydroxylase superfamily)
MLFDWCHQQSIASWCWFSLATNAALAGVSMLSCWLLFRLFRQKQIFKSPQPLTTTDIFLSVGAIFFNSSISVIGWVLWQRGWIVIRQTSLARTVVDTVLLIFVMDLAMYAFHRLAHHPLLFRIVHGSHHVHVSTNALSLFVLNPFEVLGFGSLLIIALIALPISGVALLAYLSLNLIFGTIGHLGVEPLPGPWMRFGPLPYLGTSTFHGLHHADRTHNFGFYTTIWDRLFKTLHPQYDARMLADR